MKKSLSILLILILGVNLVKSQNTNYDGSVNLVEGDLDVYVGEDLILMFDTTFYNKKHSFSGPPFLKNYKKSDTRKSNIYLPFKKSLDWHTNYNSLVGKHFKVLSIKEKQKRDKVEQYFELLLKETNEILFLATKKNSYSKDVFFPFFVVKHFEYLKQTFINKKFLGADLAKERDDDFDSKYPEIAETRAKLFGSHEPHPDKGQTELLFSKVSDITWDSKDTWVCKDIKLDMNDNPLIFVLSNNNQDVNLSLGNIYSFFFENKRIAFCDLYCEKDFVYKIYDYTPKPTPCCDSKDRLNCYKDKIKEWASIPANQLRNQKYDPNFNFNDFEIVTYNGSFILKDDKDTLLSLWSYSLKEILSEESYRRLGELKSYFYEEAFKNAQENNKVMEIFNISPSYPNSANGVSFSIDWFYYNTKKEIKYIYFTVVPYNAVGDRQYCEIRDYSTFTGSVTGPISAGSRPKEYNWENAWYNSTIESLKIIKVEIEYMDGTSYTFVKELKKIISPYLNK